jgi:ABC-2 type transport system ATP-binding protein
LFQQKLSEIKYQFETANENLGFRMLVDAVLDTSNVSHFNECINLANWQEQNESDIETFKQKCLVLLTNLEKEKINIARTENVLVSAKDIKKIYGKNNFELGPVSIDIIAGQLIGLVGENGNGKTTLLRILAKELSFTEGEIDYPFADKKMDDFALRTKLTYIPQRTPKWFGKVKDNLKLTCAHYSIKPNENEQWVSMLMIRFGLWKFRNHGWDELSSGYKMRFELARTFLRKPKLLLLDEPLANLDILSQQLILEDLKMMGKSLSNPLGIVLSSQQLYEVEKVSDEVVFLQNGKPSSFNNLKNADEDNVLVVEIEIENSKEVLLAAIESLQVQELKLIGSNFYIEIKNTDTNTFLQMLLQNKISIKYFRDISLSTRRFFNR